jgi:hypothetical protein
MNVVMFLNTVVKETTIKRCNTILKNIRYYLSRSNLKLLHNTSKILHEKRTHEKDLTYCWDGVQHVKNHKQKMNARERFNILLGRCHVKYKIVAHKFMALMPIASQVERHLTV